MADAWARFLARSEPGPADDPGGPVVVVSAHPDDEVLGLGGWLAAQAGRDTTFVTVTDGEASHPRSPSLTAADLRRRRPAELMVALRVLGHSAPRVHRLRIPDGEVAGHLPALVTALRPHVSNASLVISTFRHDGHPDHEAVAVAVAAARPRGRTPVHWQFPLWAWAWTDPGEQPWIRDLRTICQPGDLGPKRAAIAEFVTQVQPLGDHPDDAAVIGGNLLDHVLHAAEVVVV